MQGPWLVSQRWENMLFAHWRVEPEELRCLLPSRVEPDVADGGAWIGLVAFVMRGTRGLGFGPLPDIPELNMRTYVRVDGTPGVWFLTLDASSRFFAGVGKSLYGLRYHVSKMTVATDCGRTHYLSCRRNASFAASYAPRGDAYPAARGSIERFLFERYRLFSLRRGRLVTATVEHDPWRLQRAEASIELNRMAPPGLVLAGEAMTHYSRGVDARISAPTMVPPLVIPNRLAYRRRRCASSGWRAARPLRPSPP